MVSKSYDRIFARKAAAAHLEERLKIAVYGTPPREVVAAGDGPEQVSPLQPGSRGLEGLPSGSLDAVVILAPPGTIERRYVLALALKALAAGGSLTATAPKDKGGMRLKKELSDFGCTVMETSKSHYRICTAARPSRIAGEERALRDGELRQDVELGLWTQPGIFSWDRIDPGSSLLIEVLPEMTGRGADLGCGYGLLARHVLTSHEVTALTLVDIDRRAIAAARRNIDDVRAHFVWADIRSEKLTLADLDFVVMNPPFHDGGAEDKALGGAFIRRSASLLRQGGVMWLTANRHLPYEAVLKHSFAEVGLRAERDGFKVLEARR